MLREIGAPGRQWQNYPVLRERDPRGVRRLWGLALVMLAAFAPAVAYLVLQNRCVELEYDISRLRKHNEVLKRQEQRLQVAHTELGSPSDIEQWAERHPLLVRPGSERWLTVEWASSIDELIARTEPRRIDASSEAASWPGRVE